jgi:hypothetical protein
MLQGVSHPLEEVAVGRVKDRVRLGVAEGSGIGAVTARRFTVERGSVAVVDLHGGRPKAAGN